MKLYTAKDAAERLDRAQPTEVPASTIAEFNQLVDLAIASNKNTIDGRDVNKLKMFINNKQVENLIALIKRNGFNYHFEQGDSREPMDYDREWWSF